MAKKKAGYAVRMIVFVLIAAFLWRMVEYVLLKRQTDSWYSDGFSSIYENKNEYDVLFSGTSTIIGNISMEELYSAYGIAGCVIAQPRQATYLSYYSIEEALKYQKPKAVVFDVKSVFYPREHVEKTVKQTTDYLMVTLDYMKNSRTKYEAYLETKWYDPETDFWNCFLPMYYRHSNWESMREWNFTHENPSDRLNGNRLSLNISPKSYTARPAEVPNDGTETDIPVCNMKYLQKMIDLCKEKEVDLILVCGYGIYDWNWGNYNAIKKVADENHLSYLDINLCSEAIGMDWSEDVSDGVHLNVAGARKWTDYIGGYLSEKYDIPDRRQDDSYSYFADNMEKYEDTLAAMKVKQNLEQAKDFGQYMPKLLKMDKDDYTIFLAIKDDASYSLGPKRKKDLAKLGLSKSLEDKFRYSYLAVIDDGRVTVEKLSKAQVSAEGELDNGVKYELQSGGYLSGISASLILDDGEVMKNGRGINIVVYNKKINAVISSVYFDTCADKNPKTQK